MASDKLVRMVNTNPGIDRVIHVTEYVANHINTKRKGWVREEIKQPQPIKEAAPLVKRAIEFAESNAMVTGPEVKVNNTEVTEAPKVKKTRAPRGSKTKK